MVVSATGRIYAIAQKSSYVAIAALAGSGLRERRSCLCEKRPSASVEASGEASGIKLRSNPAFPARLKAGEHFHEVTFGEASTLFRHNSILLVPGMFSEAECDSLVRAAEDGASKGAGRLKPGAFKQDPWKTVLRLAAKHGVWSLQQFEPLERMPVCDLCTEAQDLSAKLLCDRLLPFLEQRLPQVAQELFGASSELNARRFSFSPDEPAINRYTSGGAFRLHTDDRSVTVYILLSRAEAFEGGGTAFWSQERRPEELQGLEEDLLLLPGQGMGVVFNGRVSHAGKVVTQGTRHLFVASFDLRPPEASIVPTTAS